MGHWHSDKLQRAWAFATHQHHGQTYGGPAEGERIEYMTHIGSVVMEVTWALQMDMDADGDLALQCAALHDTIEDTGVTLAQLQLEFGDAVAQGVLALSKDLTLPDKPTQMADSLRRIRRQPREIWMVKMADRITNLYAPPFYWGNEKILAYQQESTLIHQELATANRELADRLTEKITAYSQFLRT